MDSNTALTMAWFGALASLRLLSLLLGGGIEAGGGPKWTAGFGSLSGPIVVLGDDHGMSEEIGIQFAHCL